MAQILNHKEIRNLFGTVIINGDEACVRPNSYILRLGSEGEFVTNEKQFRMHAGEGIKLPAGQTVAVTALEIIDFGKETVERIYPGCSLYGLLSPTTDFSREGMTVPSTQVDAGYKGTLNWTINNSSPKEARFVYGEKLFRLTILKLDSQEEVPEEYYAGSYQEKEGYVRSTRKGPPTGMRETDWHGPVLEDSPEKKLEQLIKSGYPWNILGEKLMDIDGDFRKMTAEYRDIHELIKNMQAKFAEMEQHIHDIIGKIVDDKLKPSVSKVQINILAILAATASMVTLVLSIEMTANFIAEYKLYILFGVFVGSVAALVYNNVK